MTTRKLFIVLPLCGVLAGAMLIALGGCEDADARTRAEVQVKIENASQLFRDASYAERDQMRSTLNRVVSELSPINEGEPGQQAAKGQLLADALRQLAALNLREAEVLQMEHQRQRRIIQSNISSMQRLESRASALAQASTEPQRIAFQRQREELERQVHEVSKRLAELETPIADITSKNELDAQEIERLRVEADDLLRRATDLGFADGYSAYEESVILRRRADGIENRISLREIELTHELDPAKKHEQMQAESTASMLEATRATLRQLDEFDRAYAANIASLREKAEDLRREIHESIRTLNQSSTNDLEPLYEQAVSHLERAATQARQAAQRMRGEAGAARMVEARCQETLGRAYWSQARALADHIMLLASLVAADGPNGHAAQLETSASKLQELHGLAVAAYTEAQSALNAAPGRIDGVDGYRQGIEATLAMLSGVPGDIPAPDAVELDFDIDVNIDLDVDMDMPFDPSMLEGMEVIHGRDALLAELDKMDFDTVKQILASMGMDDPAMIEMMREPYNKAVETVRPKVENGEITDSIQLQEAIMEELMKAMMGGGG